MHLWTEYEGRVVDETYTLNKLLRSEGRNGFFSTADPKGTEAVIRLTEEHFDGDEQLRRWEHVARIRQQQHLIGIRRIGRTKVDDVPISFALMESNDAVLSDVLRDRPLTHLEATQVARSVASALLAVHNSGLVHEHIDADNVLAVGDVVKLRSDCVRECKPDGEFVSAEDCAALRQKDVEDFARLILRCLTLDTELHRNTLLAEPFHRFLPSALEGKLTLDQINTMLNPGPAVAPASPANSVVDQAAKPAAPVLAADSKPAPATQQEAKHLPLRFRPRNVVPDHESDDWVAQVRAFFARDRSLGNRAAYGAGALIVVLVVMWAFIHSAAKPAALTPPVAEAQPEAAATPAAAPKVVIQPAPVAAAAAVSGWHVVAYTYKRREQAQAKADKLDQTHATLQPQVFSPKGKAPYFVALGGAMTHDDAAKVLRDARHAGMPRDSFIRNY